MNFFLADVRGGIGAFVGVFLLTEGHWSADQIGTVLTISGLVGISLHPAVGSLIDATHAKRALLIASSAALAVCAIAIERWPSVPVVLAADIVMAVLGGVFAPAIAAVTLGLVSVGQFKSRLARNAVFDKSGNIFIAALVGVVGWYWSQHATFYLVPIFAALSAIAILSIPAGAIDHERARGIATSGSQTAPASWRQLLAEPALLRLAAVLSLFHFANAAMLPVLGQKLALAHPGFESSLVSASILVAQGVAIPIAAALGSNSTIKVSSRLLLTFACAALVARALLFAVVDDARILLAAQALDGISTAIWDVALPSLLAQAAAGSGRYSASRGALSLLQGIGGSLSNVFAGFFITAQGYGVTFFALAIVGVAALVMSLRR